MYLCRKTTVATVFFAFVGLGTATADRLKTYEATLSRLTNIALGCAELQGVVACRGDIKDVRDVLLTRMTIEQAEKYIKKHITGIKTVAKPIGKQCIIPAMLSDSVQDKVNIEISKIKLREDLIGREFSVTDLDINLKGTDYKFSPGDTEKAKKLAASNEEVAACFPHFTTRMSMLKDEYDRLTQAMLVRSNNGASFPFLGTYGAPDAKWDGCQDARLQREGFYVNFSSNSIFAHESSCKFLSWHKVNNDNYEVKMICASSKKPVIERFAISHRTLSYRGRNYRRCDHQI